MLNSRGNHLQLLAHGCELRHKISNLAAVALIRRDCRLRRETAIHLRLQSEGSGG